MTKDLGEIQKTLTTILKNQAPILQVRKETEAVLEIAGTKEVMQGKQKVQGHYFASVMPKPKDIRFYFFPIYTHASAFEDISPELKKYLKGKSCFHIKKMNAELATELETFVKRGVVLYQTDNLI